MDFAFSDDQRAIGDLARGILEKEVTPARLKKCEQDPEWFDAPLWRTLADAGLLGVIVPAELGGMGFGVPELCTLLHEVGRVLAPVPALPTLVLGALPIARFGTPAQQRTWLPDVGNGAAILTAALVETGAVDPCAPATTARRADDGWVLDGRKLHVPALLLARRVLIPATTPDGPAIFLIDPRSPGVAITPQRTSTGEPLAILALAGVRVAAADVLGGAIDSGAEQVAWLHQCALVATAALQVGVAEKALALTAEYVRDRVQFGVPIGSFQAVQHRAADCYIDLEAMRWVTWRAAWQLSRGLPATRETLVAKFWAAEAGARIAAAAQHLHGGIGSDVDYPVHRYFLWAKALELSLGAASPQLVALGRDMAAHGPEELA